MFAASNNNGGDDRKNNNNNNNNNDPLDMDIDLDIDLDTDEEEQENGAQPENDSFREYINYAYVRLGGPANTQQLAPNAPVKTNGPVVRRIRRGLPRPFEPRPAARRILFDTQAPMVPAIPPCPRRRPSRRAESRINRSNQDGIVRRRLNFEVNDDEEQSPQPSSSGACEIETPIMSLLKAPKKKRTFAEVNEAMEQEVEQVEHPCPPTPDNSPATPEDAMDVEERWVRIATPASAPLPVNVDSPRVPRSRRRRSDGQVLSRKRLMF